VSDFASLGPELDPAVGADVKAKDAVEVPEEEPGGGGGGALAVGGELGNPKEPEDAEVPDEVEPEERGVDPVADGPEVPELETTGVPLEKDFEEIGGASVLGFEGAAGVTALPESIFAVELIGSEGPEEFPEVAALASLLEVEEVVEDEFEVANTWAPEDLALMSPAAGCENFGPISPPALALTAAVEFEFVAISLETFAVEGGGLAKPGVGGRLFAKVGAKLKLFDEAKGAGLFTGARLPFAPRVENEFSVFPLTDREKTSPACAEGLSP